MTLRSTFARLLIAALAVVAVGTAVDRSLPADGSSWIPEVLTEAGEGLRGR